MRAINIQWDTDGNTAIAENLPSEIGIPSGMTDPNDISDYLSEQTGFCHFGYELTNNE